MSGIARFCVPRVQKIARCCPSIGLRGLFGVSVAAGGQPGGSCGCWPRYIMGDLA